MAFHPDHAGWQETPAFFQRRAGAIVDDDGAARLQTPGDPALARQCRVAGCEEPSAGRTIPECTQGMQHFSRGDDQIGSRPDSDFRRDQLGNHPAARQLASGIARHRLDLGRDLADHIETPRFRVKRGRRGVKPVDVGEQHHAIGRNHRADPGG